MFNFNAYCFCPMLISQKISDPEFFLDLLVPSTVNSQHHLLLDCQEILWLEYLEASKDDIIAFTNLDTWKKSLNRRANKILFSKVDHDGEVDSEFLSKVALKSPSTCRRYIVTNDNESYAEKVGELKAQGVELLSEFNIEKSATAREENIPYNATSFYHHMLEALSLVASSRASRLENEHNDHLRDLLSFKGYVVKDQSRLGRSATGRNVGSLDLVIFDNNNWVTIIEPLKLASVDKSNIMLHYNKLISNYNPLQLPNTHLVVYYAGNASGFDAFYNRYLDYVSGLSEGDFMDEVLLERVTVASIKYSGIRSFIQQGTINGKEFSCSHTCVAFSG